MSTNTSTPETVEFDLEYRPAWYAGDPVDAVRGTLRRHLLEQHGIGPLLEEGWTNILSPKQIEKERALVLQMAGPAALSGEDLPELGDGSIELCRITLLGTVHEEVTSVYATPAHLYVSQAIDKLEEEMGYTPAEDWQDDWDAAERDEEYEDEGTWEEYRSRREQIEEYDGDYLIIEVVDEVGLHDDEPFDIDYTHRPFSMGDLIRYLDSCDWWGTGSGLVEGALIYYNDGREGDDVIPWERAGELVEVSSWLYPELKAYYRHRFQQEA